MDNNMFVDVGNIIIVAKIIDVCKILVIIIIKFMDNWVYRMVIIAFNGFIHIYLEREF